MAALRRERSTAFNRENSASKLALTFWESGFYMNAITIEIQSFEDVVCTKYVTFVFASRAAVTTVNSKSQVPMRKTSESGFTAYAAL